MICKYEPPRSIHEREDYLDSRENQARPYPRWKLILDIVVIAVALGVAAVSLWCSVK